MTESGGSSAWIAVVGVPPEERDHLAEVLGEWRTPYVFDRTEELLSTPLLPGGGDPEEETGRAGLLLLGSRVEPAGFLQAVTAASAHGHVAAEVRIRRDNTGERAGEGIRVRPFSPGYEEPLDRFMARWTGERGGVPLELRGVLDRVRRVRHDINNPLTAALAEIQLLLMDETEGETRESLEVVQEQLRRIRDRVHELAVLRPPSDGRTTEEP